MITGIAPLIFTIISRPAADVNWPIVCFAVGFTQLLPEEKSAAPSGAARKCGKEGFMEQYKSSCVNGKTVVGCLSEYSG